MTPNKKKLAPLAIVCALSWMAFLFPSESLAQRQDSTRNKKTDTLVYRPTKRPTFRPSDRYGDPFSNTTTTSPLFLKDPNKLTLDVDIDTALNYTLYEKIGDVHYRPTTTMSFEEFKQYQDRKILKEYWQGRSRAMDGESAVSGRDLVPKIFISPVLDRIFGGSYVELIPRGFVTLDFGGTFQKLNNPLTNVRQQRNGSFEFNQQINMSVVGKVGEKLAVTANFDNNNSFDFQNNMKVEYTGYKEDILQKLEIGNVSLPLNNTLIQGAQNLFGVKAQMQFGKLNVTTIASTQRGKVASIDIPGGNKGQGRNFELIASGYDDNRHYFLSHFFRDNYREWIQNLPQITSGVLITRVEVYVVNRNNDTQTLRNVVGLMDLGEGLRAYNKEVVAPHAANKLTPADNELNKLNQMLTLVGPQRSIDNFESNLLPGLKSGIDYEKITSARKLAPTEFTFHSQLGYITLSRKLQNDEVLAVAYEYTYNGRHFKVGELTNDADELKGDEVLFLKLLRQRNLTTLLRLPTWNLMMKNIYSLNVNQVARENFQLRVIYRDDASGIDNPNLQEGSARLRDKQLIEIFGLDKLNPVNDPQRDGNFDFVPGITINPDAGLIIFPFLEPFSEALREQFKFEESSVQDRLIQKYSYDTLYRTTKAEAELFANKNKFWLKGTYTSSGSSQDILIPGFGVSPGSVKIFAGGIPLNEGTDFTVDYNFGKVTILNQSILSSGKNISVQYEQSDPFSFQTRSLIGTRFDYKYSDDVNFGSTILYYNERPLISRNQIGTEPARNVQYGFDFNVKKDSRLLTKMVDALPIIQTKEKSTFNVTGEFAQLLPGTSNIVNGEGIAYIDDFENSATPYSLMSPQSWKLAAVPNDNAFTAGRKGDVHENDRRAKLAWYTIDNLFYRENSRFRPDNITEDDVKNHYVRGVSPQEIFPFFQRQQGNFYQSIFDIAYYPNIRGQYNYNTSFSTVPVKDQWAGITTAIKTEVDFDKANIEYIEFWVMDPFLDTYGNHGKVITNGKDGGDFPGNASGKLVFQLGNISEDVIPDEKHAFENGLPTNGVKTPDLVDQNAWGYVTRQNFVTNAFNNESGARENQDVGLDGANDLEEQSLFGTALGNDPAGDNFRHWSDDSYNEGAAQVLERYRDFNGVDGNSPLAQNSAISRAASLLPDNEDLNADNTLSDLEAYYQYEVNLSKSQMEVGKPFIVDKITNTPVNVPGEPVTWYLFRIPIRGSRTTVGDINGFKSVRYMRMIMQGFDKPVVLRLANFRFVGSRWRKFQGDLRTGFALDQEPYDDFNLSVVNLEENGFFENDNNTSAYMIPPGVRRDRDNTSSISRQLNEQSIQVCVDELKDGDARAIYKISSADLFNYGRIKMYLHANSTTAKNGELAAFLRLGTDTDQNYYEIEIPLTISDPHVANDAEVVWPSENQIDLSLNHLLAMKLRRDSDPSASTSAVYTYGEVVDERHTIRILGRPDLSSVQVMMIGVRNKRSPDDSRAHSVCIWANELRVTDFNRVKGYAMTTTVNTKLADFATLTGALRYTTFGFGNVSSKIGERTRDETTTYDVSANVNVDKLLPGNSGIKVPMFVSYENTTINPQYDPANPDTRIDAALQAYNTSEEKHNFVKLIQDRTTRRSLNFVNVRKTKVKQDAVSHIYDIENLAFSYSYSEANQTNFFTQESLLRQYKASVAYNFSPKATGVEPFKNADWLKSPYLKFVKDFNLSLLPSNISIRGDFDRSFGRKVYRIAGVNQKFESSPANYLKYFFFNRNYNVRWPISKSLTFDYTAQTNAIIDEPEGDIDTQEKKDSIVHNLQRLGRMKAFNQTVTVNYTLPLDKFPITDWLGAEYRYQAGYNWQAGPLNIMNDAKAAREGKQDLADSLDFRNTIQNNRENNFTSKIDLVKLYNKIGFLKEINTPAKPKTPSRAPQPSRPTVTSRNAQVQKNAPKEDTVKSAPPFVRGFFRLLMSARSINGTYTRNEGMQLPGFDPTPKAFGMDEKWNAPGWNFILGGQDANYRYKAAEKGWLVQKRNLTKPYVQTRDENISLRATLEPSQDFKVQIDVKKEVSSSFNTIFRYDTVPGSDGDNFAYRSLQPNRTGAYRISFNSIRTAFDPSNNDLDSKVFQQFEQNLTTVHERFSREHSLNYESTDQDVVIPAFIAAYSGKSANTVSLSPFPATPLPNWRVDYTGLTKIGALKDVFQSVTISHAYQSSYGVMNYNNSLDLSDSSLVSMSRRLEDYNVTYTNSDANPIYVISMVTISEQFAPLIGINVRTKGRLTARAEYKTKRDLMLNISNAEVSEQNNKEIAFDLGYTKNNLALPFKAQGRTIVLKNDVTFKFTVSITNGKTIQRKIDRPAAVTSGTINYQFRPNISYVVNQKLTLQAYFERTINEAVVSTTSRRANTKFGIQVRFSLAQ